MNRRPILGISGLCGTRRASDSLGVFILLNKVRMLRLGQKHLRLNVGRVGSDVAEVGRSSHLIGPGLGLIVIGAIVVLASFRVA